MVSFQMFKSDLEKAEETEIKLPTSIVSHKKQENSRKKSTSRKTSTSVYWLCQSFCLCGSQQAVENSSRDGNTRPPYLPPENMYAGQEATGSNRHGTKGWLQTGKGVCQGCVLSPCLFNLYAEYIMWNSGLDDKQAGIKIARRNNNNLRGANDTTLMPESEEELKNLLMKERGEWKSWLKTQHSEN